MTIWTCDGVYTIEKCRRFWRVIYEDRGVIGWFKTRKAAVDLLKDCYNNIHIRKR